MEYKKLFRFLIISEQLGEDSVIGRLIQAIIDAIQERDYQVKQARSDEEAQVLLENDPALGCFLIAWGKDFQIPKRSISQQTLIDAIRKRGLEAPIFLMTEKREITDIPQSYLKEIKGCIFPQEDTPDFIARYVIRAYDEYIMSLKTPFFGGIVDYVESGNDMWLAPGHNGGVFYQKSPIGRIFYEFLGENFFRADFNFVPDLGSIFGHSGKFLQAEQSAAQIFGADRTYFVLNGTTTSNKVVNCALVAEGDLVLYDRNNHKSNVQSALMLSGGIPIYLPNDHNPYGMVGPVEYDAWDENALRQRIKDNPLVKDPEAWRKERPFRLAIIDNCTYDGTIYNVKTILEKIGHLCDYILFDEAWGAFMRFHPIYEGRYALSLTDLTDQDSGLVVTQSTHKQLAGMSQASQIHVKDAHIKQQVRRLNHQRMNEIYMMHTSTSPYYPMFASLDVGAQMMKGKNGQFLWDEAIKLGIDIRKRIRKLAAEYGQKEFDPQKQWFFEPFVPERIDFKPKSKYPEENLEDIPWEEVPTEILAVEPQCWIFKPGESWHGYRKIKGDYVMLDPTKLLFLLPGINRKTGEYEGWGIPASILGAFMRGRGIVPEKTDFNSILFLITPGIEKSKAGKLLAELVRFKELFDKNALVSELIPGIEAEFPRYQGVKIKTLCQEMHDTLRKYNAKELQQAMFRREHFPTPVMTPHEAHNELVANRVDYVPLSEIKGRIAATLGLVYPPGTGVIIPGERYDEAAEPQLKYFRMFEEFNQQFPGFENEIQGLYLEPQADGTKKYYTYVVREKS
ncbi:MAG TPA: Orn/Lys/Arg decarboxylase N-terminal domain-containing protein [Bacillota bacterium]|nr:Orn/Lys/Arg decarboxylase N-terminal domain-containing protein [Bacillota bacterium]